jgi:N-acetylneuraminic acid mutarotase
MGGVRVTAGSKAFVWGGMISHLDSGELSGQGFLYDPATNSWIEVKTPDGIRPRLQMGAAALGPQVLVFGGCLDGKLFSTECSQHSNDGFLVDADQAVARKISSDGAPQNLQQPRIHPIGRGFLVMEQSLAGSKVEGAYYYSPEEDSWTRLDLQSALTSRVNHVAIPIDSNTLMIWGGLDSKGISRAGAVIQFVPPGPE